MVLTQKRKPSNRSKALGFYTPAEASRISQVPQWTVNYWRRNGVVVPSVEWIDERNKVHIGHNFETVVFLRLIRLLREKDVTLVDAVMAIKSLRERFGTPSKRWSDAKIFVNHKHAYAYDKKDDWGTTVVTQGNQKVADFLLGEEFSHLKERADALLIPEQFIEYVEIDPAVKSGLPIILGTSVLTSLIHTLKSQGYGYTIIHEMYPFLETKKIIGADQYETYLDQPILAR